MRVYPERVVVAAEGQIVCEHGRVFARSHRLMSGATVYDWRRYLAVIQRKPGALSTGAPRRRCWRSSFGSTPARTSDDLPAPEAPWC